MNENVTDAETAYEKYAELDPMQTSPSKIKALLQCWIYVSDYIK